MNNVSSMAMWPVVFNALSAQVYKFENGLNFAIHPAFKMAQDVAVNQQTSLILSDLILPTNFLKAESPDQISELSIIASPLSVNNSALATTWDGTYLVLSAIPLTPQNNLATQEIFTFCFNATSVQVLNQQNLYLSIHNYNVFFAPQSNSLQQSFDYFLGDTSICLFKTNTNWSSALAIYANTLAITSTPNLIGEIALTLTSRNSVTSKTSPVSSCTVTYINNPTQYTEELQIDNKSLRTNFYQNWLFQFPIEIPQFKNGAANYNLKFHPLKNHQTPLGDYTYEPNNFEVKPGVQKQYSAIFAGGSQTKGFERVYLGYQSGTTTIEFKPDEPTTFRFCPTADAMPLSSAGFIENGALGGNFPLIADRISVLRKDYTKQSPNFPIPNDMQPDGIWLCSWLSGNQTNKVWMDRYYNPGYFSLSADAINFFTEKQNPTKGYIWDVPSNLKLEPGIQYQYIHNGRQSGEQAINLIEIDPQQALGFKTLHISAWNTPDQVLDASPYNQYNKIVNQQKLSPTEYFHLDGANHIVFSANSSLLLNTDFTASLWVYADNWHNLPGSQIFGNFDQSGWGLINRQQPIAPLFSIIDQNNNSVYTLNYKLTLTETNKLSAGHFSLICRLADMSYWVVDDLNLIAYHYDVQQNLLAEIFVPLYTPSHIIADANANVYIFDSNNLQYVKIEPNLSSLTLTPSSTPNGTQSLILDKTNTLVFSTAGRSVVTSDNKIWEYTNGTIFYADIANGFIYNRQLFAAIGNCYGVVADSKDRVYFLLDDAKVACLDTKDNQFIWTKQIGKVASTNRYISVLKAPVHLPDSCLEDATLQDLLVVIDNHTKEIFVTDSKGLLLYYLNATNLPALANPQNLTNPNFIVSGDFSGFNSIRLQEQQELVWAIQPQDSPYPIYLPTNQFTLSPGWHLFTLVVDSQTQAVQSYVDSILISTSAFHTEVDYKYKAPLLLGATSVMSTTLNNIIGVENVCKFVGRVADVRVYRKPLMFDIIQQLYWNSPVLQIPRPNLVWNMATGQRNYIEEIQRWFIFNLPGHKSKYFNINIYNYPATPQIKMQIEAAIKANIKKLTPGYSQLYKINWLNTK